MIDAWLKKFISGWEAYDIDTILSLFTEDVLYYESPFEKYRSREELRYVWETVKQQQQLRLDARRLVSENNLHTVQWELQYEKDDRFHVWEGLYIVQLNGDGLCTYFLQVGEEKK